MSIKEADRRQQILDAAQKVFAKKGFEGASIKDLAKAARISPGLLYWYFKDKAHIFVTLLSERIEAVFGSLPENISFDLPPSEFLPRFGRLYASTIEQPMNITLFKVMIANSQSLPPVVRELQAVVVNRVLDTLKGYFQKQIEAGRMRPCDVEMATRTFMGALVGYLLLKHILQDKQVQELSSETMVNGISDIVVRGIQPPAQ